MAKLKSERHHWWPECVSQFWIDADGKATRLSADGETLTIPPKNFGVIQNGHMIKLAKDPTEFCPWDENYEAEFRNADNNFPRVIDWLQQVGSDDRRQIGVLRNRWEGHSIDQAMFNSIVECAVSLAVRSPRTRERSVALAEHFRGPLPERERNGLIGANLRHFHRNILQNIGDHGKLAVVYTPEREFIFGDGFFHNFDTPPNPPHFPSIIVPFTPNMAIIYSRPMSYTSEPRFVTMVLTDQEVDALNDAVQIYSRKTNLLPGPKTKDN